MRASLLAGTPPTYAKDPLVELVREYQKKREIRTARSIQNQVSFTRKQLLETLNYRISSSSDLKDSFQCRGGSYSFGSCLLMLGVEPGDTEYPVWGAFRFSVYSEPIFFYTHMNGPLCSVKFRPSKVKGIFNPASFEDFKTELKKGLRGTRLNPPQCQVKETTAAALVETALTTLVKSQIAWTSR